MHRVTPLIARALLWSSLAPIAGCSADSAGQPATAVAWIVIDTLRADQLGVYGSNRGLTPVLDAFGAEAVVFENAIATSAWTKSSVASMLTSRYPTALGVLGRDDALGDQTTMVAELLASSGFDTLAVSANRNAGRPYGFARGFDSFEIPDLTAGYPDDVEVHTAEGITLKGLQLVDDRASVGRLFLFLHYVDPHDPYLPHPGLLAAPEPPGRFDGSRGQLAALDRLPAHAVTETDRARIRYLYEGEVRYVDRWVGELLAGLEKRRLLDDALVIVTSDHGEGLWNHGFRGHGRDLYEEMIHVPLLVQRRVDGAPVWRGRVTSPVSLVDLAPTVLAATGIEEPPAFQGSDLARHVLRGGDSTPPSTVVFSELDLDGRSYEVARGAGVKIVRNRHAARPVAFEAFDLDADPDESLPRQTEEVAGGRWLAKRLDRWSREMTQERIEAPSVSLVDLDPETLRQLRALGYLDAAGDARSPRGPGARAPLSRLDFSDRRTGDGQLLYGFFELENDRRWIAAQAGVELARPSDASRWRLTGWIDLSLHGTKTLVIEVRIDGRPADRRVIDASGFFLLEGELPEGTASPVLLELACDHHFEPAQSLRSNDLRQLCVVVHSLELLTAPVLDG